MASEDAPAPRSPTPPKLVKAASLLVAEEAHVTREDARRAIDAAGGDTEAALLSLDGVPRYM